ncbi:glycohydrolase toxin TNT-related protein [Anaerocolumna xylanovorans]|uniref:TNT domain-containing protein n=1 Tax=Anaerocolumna xylanovorans DSM 12503 TaxID=1121345 RepID=A0A1M7Y681_9FIRM|nr:glycohydrolase toxin TNT-related protein [Anaerocolumna xylanovorans]SHO48101.1 Protein of unknown function [Anaerocolumna xylanovorans DSM 12503]
MKRKRWKRGSVTIEATIALTAFLFAFMMLYDVVTLCRAQTKIGVAINNTAKEISQYSYIYGLTGIKGSLDQLNEAAGGTRVEINDVIKNVDSSFQAIQSLSQDASGMAESLSGDLQGGLDSWDKTGQSIKNVYDTVSAGSGDIKEDAGQLKESVTAVQAQIEAMAENPQQLMFGMAKMIVSEGISVAQSKLIAEPVSRALIKKHLKRAPGDTAEGCLKALEVVPDGSGSYLKGLDFTGSMLFPSQSDDILVVVTYKVKLFPYLPLDIEFTIRQTAITKGWLMGDGQTVDKTYLPTKTDAGKETETTPTPIVTPSPTPEPTNPLLAKTTLTKEQLYIYLKVNYGAVQADLYDVTGELPEDVQIPKNMTVLNGDKRIDWDQVPKNGYVLKANGEADKDEYDPKKGEVIDRYGPSNGTFTSPVIDGKSYSYDERSLPYVEDDSKYHQYEFTDDLSKLKEYITTCKDEELVKEIDSYMEYKNIKSYDELKSYQGKIAGGFGSDGGGIQYQLPLPVNILEELGIIKKIK